MSDKDLSSAIRSIIEKEINKVSKLVPKEALNNIEKNLSPQIDQIIEKSGSWFSYGGSKLGQGRDSVKSILKDNPELMEELEQKIVEELKSD